VKDIISRLPLVPIPMSSALKCSSASSFLRIISNRTSRVTEGASVPGLRTPFIERADANVDRDCSGVTNGENGLPGCRRDVIA
jgi:hypothetical protein